MNGAAPGNPWQAFSEWLQDPGSRSGRPLLGSTVAPMWQDARKLTLHRHLNHQQFTLAAIDDAVERGGRRDWAELRRAALADRSVMEKILLVCRACGASPSVRGSPAAHSAGRRVGGRCCCGRIAGVE